MEVLCAFKKALPGVSLEANQNFFLHGGDSVGAAQVAEILGVRASLVVAHPTVRSLAKALHQRLPMNTTGEGTSMLERKGPEGGLSSGQPPPVLCWMGSDLEVATSGSRLLSPSLRQQIPDRPADSAALALVPGTIAQVLSAQGDLLIRAAIHSDEVSVDEGSGDPSRGPRRLGGVVADEAKGASRSGEKSKAERGISCVWRCRLDMCVDKPPVLLVPRSDAPLTAAAGGRERTGASPPPEDLRVLCCSHGGDVVLLRGSDGLQLWRAQLPFPADGGLAVTSDLSHAAVASGEFVYFLEASDRVANQSFLDRPTRRFFRTARRSSSFYGNPLLLPDE
jgi:hypothetical protein